VLADCRSPDRVPLLAGRLKGGACVQREMHITMNAMNICLLILCVGIAVLIYWGGFAEERRANRKVD